MDGYFLLLVLSFAISNIHVFTAADVNGGTCTCTDVY